MELLDDGLLEENKMKAINRLYHERDMLMFDSENHKDAISRIDYQLELLGVEFMPEAEAMLKICGPVQTYATPQPSTANTSWTSTRTIYVYHGTQYEVQIIKAISTTDDFEDVNKYDNYPLSGYSSFGIKENFGEEVANKEILRISLNAIGETIVDCFLSGMEDNHPYLSAIGKGLIDYLKFNNETNEAEEEALTGIVDITYLDYKCDLKLLSTEEYIFVKTPNNPDEGHQVFMYLGNQIKGSAKMSGTGAVTNISNSSIDVVIGDTIYFTAAGANYYDRYRAAVMNFINYRAGYSFTVDNLMYNLEITLMNHAKQSYTTTIYTPRIKYIGYF